MVLFTLFWPGVVSLLYKLQQLFASNNALDKQGAEAS